MMRSRRVTLTLVPFLDVGASYLELRDEIDDAISRVMLSGSYILGPEVAAFESEFAEFVRKSVDADSP